MLALIASLLVFAALHLLPSFPRARERVRARLGPAVYGALFGLLSTLSLVWVILAWRDAPHEALWAPPIWARHLALLLVPVALVLASSALLPHGHLRRLTVRPLYAGTILWALAHLLANASSASLVLFAGFMLYAVPGYALALRGPGTEIDGSPRWDALALLLGLVLSAFVLMWFHPVVIGVDPLP